MLDEDIIMIAIFYRVTIFFAFKKCFVYDKNAEPLLFSHRSFLLLFVPNQVSAYLLSQRCMKQERH